jgi:hypothetical protein
VSLIDDITRGIGSAVADLRHKVVEEPYFGRVVTDGPGLPPDVLQPAVEPPITPRPGLAQQVSGAPEPAPERQAPDLDFEC